MAESTIPPRFGPGQSGTLVWEVAEAEVEPRPPPPKYGKPQRWVAPLPLTYVEGLKVGVEATLLEIKV